MEPRTALVPPTAPPPFSLSEKMASITKEHVGRTCVLDYEDGGKQIVRVLVELRFW